MAIIASKYLEHEGSQVGVFAHSKHEYYENLITLSFTSYSPYVDFSTHMTAAFARKLSEQLLALADIADPQASFAGPYDAHAPQDEVPQGPEEYDKATIASTLATAPAVALFDELDF